jgi:hypothetical protein
VVNNGRGIESKFQYGWNEAWSKKFQHGGKGLCSKIKTVIFSMAGNRHGQKSKFQHSWKGLELLDI